MERGNSLVLANEGGEPHDDGGKGGLDVLVGVGNQLLDAGQELGQDGVHTIVLAQSLAER